jgi:hypothetical protein
MIMETARPPATITVTITAIVDRLAVVFPGLLRHDLEQAVGVAWSLFSATHADVALRAAATEWYVRDQLAAAKGQ